MLEKAQCNNNKKKWLHKSLYLKRPFFQGVKNGVEINIMQMIPIVLKQIGSTTDCRTDTIPDN